MIYIDKEKFAQSVLMSEKKELTLEQKLDLYVKAMELAAQHNKEIPKPKMNMFGTKAP
ncbi:hypothetical protein [Vagococcus martis]|uniref:hypothetical protein n=1 Tax=Vagococcus martis TaxID=1768210 RepID=UPI0013019D9D|nr:hypothetical protein [Vagococcus martis]